jgi:hypothetical protein
MSTSNFSDTLSAIELNTGRKLNWDYNQLRDYLSFTVNNEAIEVVTKNKILQESELETLKEALLDYGFQYKKTIDNSILVFEQDVELR